MSASQSSSPSSSFSSSSNNMDSISNRHQLNPDADAGPTTPPSTWDQHYIGSVSDAGKYVNLLSSGDVNKGLGITTLAGGNGGPDSVAMIPSFSNHSEEFSEDHVITIENESRQHNQGYFGESQSYHARRGAKLAASPPTSLDASPTRASFVSKNHPNEPPRSRNGTHETSTFTSATASTYIDMPTFHPLSDPHNEKSLSTPTAAETSSLLEHQPISTGSKKATFFDSQVYWLGMYFMFNLGLTLFNKVVLVSFPFPYTLTGLHALSGTAGCFVALKRGYFVPARLNLTDNLIMAAFSVLYTINIAVSNISLQLVTVPFHQVVRAATPLFTIFISVLFLKSKFSMRKLVSLLPVVAGVGFATYGDYYFTLLGLLLTLLGTFLAALKTVVTNIMQTGGGGRLKLHPLDLLMRMSPLAFIQCVVYGHMSGELERVRRYGAREMNNTKLFALLINGIIAFGLNVVSFTANKKTSALTMTVAANVKQVLTIVLAVIIFDLTLNPVNMLGISLTLVGGAFYAYIEFTEKVKKAQLHRT